MFSRRAQRILQRAALAGLALAFAGQAGAATITGTVFEDRNYGGGAGRSLLTSAGQPLEGVRVELYRQSNGNFVDSDTTDANGQYSLSSGNNTNVVIVRVVNGSVRSARTGGRACTTCVPVQTYRTDASSGSAIAVTNRVGGENPALSDAAQQNSGNFSNLNTASQAAQSTTTVAPASSGATISGIDFGFNFDTVVSTRGAKM